MYGASVIFFVNARPAIVAGAAIGVVAAIVAIKKLSERRDSGSLLERADVASRCLQSRLDSLLGDVRSTIAR